MELIEKTYKEISTGPLLVDTVLLQVISDQIGLQTVI